MTDRPFSGATGASLYRPLGWLLAIGLSILLLWVLGKVVLLVFAAVLLSVLLSAPANWISLHTGIRRGWCLAFVIGGTIATLAGAGIGLAPRIVAQFQQVATLLPAAFQHTIDQLRQSSAGRFIIEHAAHTSQNLADPILHSLPSVAVGVGSIVFVVAVGVYFAATPWLYERAVLRLVPPQHRGRVREIANGLAETLEYFLGGRVFSMSVIMICSMIGLWVLGDPAPIALGLMAGLLSFVPYVGSAASAIPPFLLAYARSPIDGVYVLVLYLFIHFLDGYILVPLVQRRMVHLAPGFTLTAQLVMGVLWGILGIAVATPLAALLATLVEMIYVENVLDNRPH